MRAQTEAPPPPAPPPRASESRPCSWRCSWSPPRRAPGQARCARPWWWPGSPRSCAGRTSACPGRSSAEMRAGMNKQLLSEIFLLHLQLTSYCFCSCPTRWLRCKILDLISLYKLSLQVVSAWMWLFYCLFHNCEIYFSMIVTLLRTNSPQR